MIASLRIVWRVASSRSRNVAESELQGSNSVPVIGLSVRIVPASRFSDAMGKYWLTTATLRLQTVSKSDEGTTKGLGSTGAGVKIRLTRGRLQVEGPAVQPAWLPPRTASMTSDTAPAAVFLLPIIDGLALIPQLS